MLGKRTRIIVDAGLLESMMKSSKKAMLEKVNPEIDPDSVIGAKKVKQVFICKICQSVAWKM